VYLFTISNAILMGVWN